MKLKKQIGVYVISNINPSRCPYINKICANLDNRYRVFKPHLDNKYNVDNAEIEFNAFYVDKVELDKADISFVLMPLFGRDCAAEIGYSRGIKNCIIAYVDKMESKQEKDWLNDWMVKGFIDYIITVDKKAYSILYKNPLIIEKERFEHSLGKSKVVHLIDSPKELSNIMEILLDERKKLGKKK